MYFDTLATAELSRYPARIAKAIEWLRAQDVDNLPAGRQEIDGNDNMFAQVIDLKTQPESEILPECHRKYLDVQYLHRGKEIQGIAIETGNNTINQAYDEEKDILFYKTVENENFLHVNAGQFSVFFPSDIHRPGIALSEPVIIRKIVVKIALDSL